MSLWNDPRLAVSSAAAPLRIFPAAVAGRLDEDDNEDDVTCRNSMFPSDEDLLG